MGKDISFGTFNLYNLQLPGEPWRNKPYTAAQYSAKIKWSAQMLRALDAEVIGFQELWFKKCLEDVFEEAGLQNDYELHFIKDILVFFSFYFISFKIIYLGQF